MICRPERPSLQVQATFDLPIWDRMFGTYRDTDTFAAQCGFPRHNERKLGRMLLFRDVYGD